HAEHLAGKSILALSKETGVSRVEINRRFKKLGLEWRNMSEAAILSASQHSPEFRKKRAEKAHAARRGSVDGFETKCKRAKGRTNDRIGMFELEIVEHLRKMGAIADNQWPFGIYNIDIAIHLPTVAVEVYSMHPSRARMAQLHERTKYILNQGVRSEEHTSELQSRENLVCRLLLEKKKQTEHE